MADGQRRSEGKPAGTGSGAASVAGESPATGKSLSPVANLSLALVLFILETTAAAFARQPILPYALCGLVVLAFVLYAVTLPLARWSAVGRFLTVGLLFKTSAVGVALTGGIVSPYLGTMFLPIFLGALYFGLGGSTLLALSTCIYMAAISWRQIAHGGPAAAMQTSIVSLATHSGVFLLVAAASGGFVEQMRQTTWSATRRARLQAARATQVEFFTDTAVMMESLYDLEHMLSAALLRLDQLVACDSVAIFLREGDDTQLSLAQTLGLPAERVTLHLVPVPEPQPLRSHEFISVFLPDLEADSGAEWGELARLDPEARSVIIVPLVTYNDLFGVLYVGAKKAGALTERDRDSLVQFAKHIVYPIQRVRLQAMATTDVLTGLNNRRGLRRRMRDEVERARRYRHSLALLMIDIDHFKRVNDTLGHRAGDAILAQLGGVLRRASRGIDFAARYGGEEMALLCPETTLDDGRLLANRIRATVEATRFALPDGRETSVTVSVGVSVLDNVNGTEMSLVESADRALYQAKEKGRNQVCVAPALDIQTAPARPTAAARTNR